MNTKQTAFQSGLCAEKKVIVLLKYHGFEIIKHRYRTSVGEIDIIALKDNVIHIVEVKHRSRLTEVRECLTQRQRRRIEQATEIFAAENPLFTNCSWQFDVAFEVEDEIRFLECAWNPEKDRW